MTGLSNAAAMTNSYTFENDKIKTISHNGFTYEYNYDVWGNKTEVKIGSTILSQTDYGTGQHRDRVSEVTYANGQSVSYTYDSDSNITAISYDGGQTDQYEYAYDNEGILTQITDNHAGWKTLYTGTDTEVRSLSDNSLLFSSVTDETGATEKSVFGSPVAYTYNSAYNAATGVTTDTVVMAKEVQIGNDDDPIPALMENTIDSQKDWFGRTVTKQAEGNMRAEGLSQSLTSEIEYSYADTATTATTRLASYSQTITGKDNTVTTTEYFEYDALGNITGIYRYIDNIKTYYNRYYYDEASQIVREDNRAAGKTITYQYDKGGNLAQTAEYNYTEGSLAELTASQTDAYSYRSSGWKDVITEAFGFTVTTDAMGNITAMSNGDGKSGVSYEWTAGRQLAKTTREENGDYYLYYYDADGFLCRYEIYNSSDACQGAMNYYWEDSKLVAAFFDEATEGSDDYNIRIIYDADGEPFGLLFSDTIPFYYSKNYLGDITGIYNFDGNPVIEYYYDAFGNMGATLPKPNDFGAALFAVLLSALNPLAYRGYLHAPALGSNCYYLGSRFYSPILHRFANADVYEDTGSGVVGTNMFAYCNNNPVLFVDPEGEGPTDYFKSVLTKLIKTIQTILSVFLGKNGGLPIFDLNNYPTSYKKYNCYAYALGIYNKWLRPGEKLKNHKDKEGEDYEYYEIDELIERVKYDFAIKNKQNNIRVLLNKNSPVGQNEYRVAVKIRTAKVGGEMKTIDCHFVIQHKDGNWSEKKGKSKPHSLSNFDPEKDIWWNLKDQNTNTIIDFYNSPVRYFAIVVNTF